VRDGLLVGEPHAEEHAKAKWDDDGAERDGDRGPPAGQDQLAVELVADDKHEEDKAKVPEAGKRRAHSGHREEMVRQADAEEGRADNYADTDLPDHGRLAAASSQRAKGAQAR
jgi:hypothetical protein